MYTSLVQITLSSKEVVTFGPWKRKAAKVFAHALKQGVVFRRHIDTGDMETTEEIPVNNFSLAYEAVLPVLIERIDRNGESVPFTEVWRDDLEPRDYDALEAAVYQLKEAAKASADKSA